ncbi:MAG: glucose-6-phosphate dehydrogenase, partial [Gammaproteobacteria bacterium]|nr:glucose-6-phosphate dehydrogenase [Gammaproteobacteria bacterium]
RRELSDEDYRAFAREGIETYSRQPLDPKEWANYERSLFFLQGAFDDANAFLQIKNRLQEIESERGVPGNRIFYLSIPPRLIELCVNQLHAAGLISPDDNTKLFSRVIVEKPIGRDLESARQVNVTLSRVLEERQTFRIDHYLGKETVQNILVMRFGNSIFEPLWNQKHIDHVQITVAEQEGVGTRAGYYDRAGALRDMVQNHILQLLSLTAMEPPWAITADVVRDHKLEVLNCLRSIEIKDLKNHVVRAQYSAGKHNGVDIPGYRRADNVEADSTTETYTAIKVFIDNWRWSGVPFYLRTGKRLPKRASEIAVQFKAVPPVLFNCDPRRPIEPNVLTLRIQPDEGLSMHIATKLPGPKVRIKPVTMDFHYGTTFDEQSPEAYERLLLDVMAGDATLFMRGDEVEASWTWITNILGAWEQSGERWLPEYAAGTWGPVEADRLIEADSRKWRIL